MERMLDARLLGLPPSAIHELVLRIAAIEELRGWWQGRGHPPPSVLARMREQAIGESAAVSLRDIPSYSSRPGSLSWTGRQAGGSRTRESALGKGHAELLRSVFDGHRDLEFGQDIILGFHGRLFLHSPSDRPHRGRYRPVSRKSLSWIRGRPEPLALRPTDPHLIREEIELLVRWTESRLRSRAFHPLLVIPSFLLEFLAIRPFADGNRRLGLVLAVRLLLSCGYGHVPYLSLDRFFADRDMDCSVALREAQSKRNLPRPDISAWLGIFLDVLEAHGSSLRALLEERPRVEVLSGNQRDALELIDRHGEASIRLVRRELRIPRDTARQVLRRLLELNLVRRAGAGRAARYLPSPPYPDKSLSPRPAR